MLSNYRVLDLTNERGHLAGFMLAQMGAEVIAVEPPGGSSARKLAPFAGDVESAETSLHHWAYNRGKKSVVVDLETDEGLGQFRRLAKGADILFESFAPGYLDSLGLGYEALAELNPALIHTSITPFGSEGPKAGWEATDLTLQASAGNMVLTGDPDRAPLRAGGTIPQAFHNAASEAAGAALIALFERQSTSGLGQHIDCSVQQSMNQATQSMSLAASLNASIPTRSGAGAKLGGLEVQLMWPCKDGYASVTLLFGGAFARFTQNLMNWVHEEGFCDEATRDKDWLEYPFMLLDGREPIEEYDRVKAELGVFFLTKTKAELLDAALTRRVLITPITTTEEVCTSAQLAERDYWHRVDHYGHGVVTHPGNFAKFTASPLTELAAPPALGEHTADVLAEATRTPAVAVAPPNPSTARPLEGVKILDFMWAMAGPAASRVLADYGAQIVRVESEHKIDAVRTLAPFPDDATDPDLSGIYNNMNAGKLGLALDMSKPEALDVIWDLIDWADVVMESFSPRAMAAWGISYDDIRKRRPDIVMTSSCLMGQTGPVKSLAGFGTMAAAISGFFYPVGWPDRNPTGAYSAYTDYTSPRWLVAALMGALEHKRATGEGQYVDLSQAEAALHLMGPALLEYNVNGRVWERAGNRDLELAPHGVYATAGDDNWIAIACTTDAAWQALATEMRAADLGALTLEQRRARHDELDATITNYASAHDGVALMEHLQELGVASHIVQNSPELVADPQLTFRGQFAEVPHPARGTMVVDGSRFVLSRTPAQLLSAGPAFGEHSFDILTDILGYDGDRIAELAVAELLE
ncbi:MAG: CoA transferase [Actinomycetota bacterium]|nr:CoA transferase [Actinomycetota bacterium]